MAVFLSEADIAEARGWRHDLHRHPELAFEEKRTAAFIAEKLQLWGFSVRSGFAGTGVIGSLTRGTSKRAIGIRADMDALPIIEKSGVDHESERPGKMHACGHDGHVAMALAAAKVVSKLEFDGTVRFIFQPAEENEGGGREMVREGLFTDFPVDAVYGLHNWPALDVGTCVARDDAMMAAFGTFEIELIGKGAHGAMPHEGADPVVAAAQLVTALQTIASRNVSPLESAVVSVTQMHGGDAWNVIPESMVIRGTTRWFLPDVGETIIHRLQELAASIASGFGCTARVDYEKRYPSTINTADNARKIRELAVSPDLGLKVLDVAPSMAAEDFAFMLQEKPGCYFWLGSRRDGSNPGLHSPYYDFNDALLPIGANFWIKLVASELASG
ncbi:M20 aminoacylase family protein [Brucella intermedia]|uniref:M20 aminoacylase family protein n=1 Tax=Brucella intermedia TaxID=94625 RepID=UPI000C29347D|nr:M20 aminoacylase family protein [Brucella intermedia]PJR91697.1 peptidase M20 [Ochrobactrum sp. 721/2009]PJT14759.1 peptidase M20 [Ochrobactrum sp. 720/2009]PJT20410.1 peptidase M20 [Ochrobactrum sp. 715/2009]PJT28380.1 peptidase M20 [Ochrobactrum sp. 695/2009]PJT34842.1 peptidase M20 [Ochrobactrum sp. 689/2009]